MMISTETMEMQEREMRDRLAAKDASIAELERLLREASYFMATDFPPDIPAESMTLDDACVTPRYLQLWKDLSKVL